MANGRLEAALAGASHYARLARVETIAKQHLVTQMGGPMNDIYHNYWREENWLQGI